MSQKVSRRLGIRNPLVNGKYLEYNVVIRSPKNESKAQRKENPEIHHQNVGAFFSEKRNAEFAAGFFHDSPFRNDPPFANTTSTASAF